MSSTSFDDSLGVLLLAGLLGMTLWGTVCTQTYAYFMHSFKDPRYMKFMVTLLWCIDTFGTALNVHMLYFYMVTNFWNPQALAEPIWSIKIFVAVSSISNFLIRTMFTGKVFFLSERNIWLCAWLLATALSDFVMNLVIAVKSFAINSFLELDNLSVLFYVNFSTSVGSDISLAVAMCIFLRRSRTGFQETDSMISTLMTYTVNSCVIVAVDAAVAMIMYIVMPKNLIYLGFYLMMSKLYVNAYLASLNARAKLRSRKEDIPSIRHSQISICRYAAENSSPVEKGNNIDRLPIGTSMLSVPMATRHPHNNTVDGLDSATAYRDGASCAV